MAIQDTARFYTLDGIRGIAAILVMMRHTIPFFGVDFVESYLAVDIFFLLSGVVITNAYERRLQSGLSVLRFIWIRVVRMYPLYMLGSLISIVAVAFGLFWWIDSKRCPSLWFLRCWACPISGLAWGRSIRSTVPRGL